MRLLVNWCTLIIVSILGCGLSGVVNAQQSARKKAAAPDIKIVEIPPAGEGSPTATKLMAGVARGPDLAQCKVVVYTHTDTWYIQPTIADPKIVIGGDGRWRTFVHPGAEYAALLVRSSYKPEATIDKLPDVGGDVLAEDVEPGK